MGIESSNKVVDPIVFDSGEFTMPRELTIEWDHTADYEHTGVTLRICLQSKKDPAKQLLLTFENISSLAMPRGIALNDRLTLVVTDIRSRQWECDYFIDDAADNRISFYCSRFAQAQLY